MAGWETMVGMRQEAVTPARIPVPTAAAPIIPATLENSGSTQRGQCISASEAV